MVKIVVPGETAPDERRVALVPESITRLIRAGVEVTVQRNAGSSAFLSDEAYLKEALRLPRRRSCSPVPISSSG